MAIFSKTKEHKEEKSVSPTKNAVSHKRWRTVLRHPHVSEKAHNLQSKNQYVFLVEVDANKPLVAEDVERRYGVKVKSVNILRKTGRAKHFRNIAGKAPMYKKAIVTLRKGEKLEII